VLELVVVVARYSENKIGVFLALLLVIAALAGGFLLGFYFYSTPNSRAAGVQNPSGVTGVAVEAVFSPGSESRLVAFVDSAQRSIDAELYQFSNSALKAALVRAVQRGVAVRLILEPKVDGNIDTAEFLLGKGVQVRLAWQGFANTHAKAAAVDESCLLAGSINWSQRAVDSNREVALITCGGTQASEFENVFEGDWAKATQVTS
jgi:phosphatidylserine/phosphatidylglycerophosphate/cardiolipin synthase-like enzyme